MNRSNVKILLLIGILLLSNTFVHNPVSADTHIIPELGDEDVSPAIDGNLNDQAWNTSATFNSTLHAQETEVFVTTNSTHLFIGFNISTNTFVSVNDTLPTTPGYDLGYNNQTHDWFAVVVDNNLDKAVSSSSIGLADNPDDVIVLDQYVSGSYDALAEGNATFTPDDDLSYNSGQFQMAGAGGTNDVDTARDVSSSLVSYEIVKPLTNVDEEGHDFLLSDLGVLQFSIFQWTDSQANDTVSTGDVDNTDWFSLRINDTGTGISTKTAGETSVNLIQNGRDNTELDGIQTAIELYGFDLTTTNFVANVTLTDFDLNILLLDDETSLEQTQFDEVIEYIRSGGNMIILLGDSSASTNLAEAFEISYLSNDVLVPGEDEASTQVTISEFNSVLPFNSDSGVVTNRTADTLEYQSSALNTTNVMGDNNSYVLDQEYMTYDLFTNPENAIYDQDGDGVINETESLDGLSLGVAFDFLKGGRASLLPTTSLFLDSGLSKADNMVYLLQMLPWNSRIVNTLDISSTDADKRTLREGDSLTVTVNMTDGLGNPLTDASVVQVEVTSAGNVVGTHQLNQVGDSMTFEGEFTITKNGFLKLEITGFSDGNGFAEGDAVDIYVEADIRSFNDLSQLSVVIIALFSLSLVALVLVAQRVRNY